MIFLSNVFIFHLCSVKRRFFMLVKLFFGGTLLYSALFFTLPESLAQKTVSFLMPTSLFIFLTGAFLHFFFLFFYLYCIQLVDRSPSARMMIEIEDSGGKRTDLEEIKQLYQLERKVREELEDMTALGNLEKEGDYYRVTARGRKYLHFFKSIRDYLGLRRS